MELIATLIRLALDALELEPQDVSELEIAPSGFNWSVLIGNQEVFISESHYTGKPELQAYHVNCYD